MKVKLLGVDYGEAWVGVAMATTPLAEPVKTVEVDEAIGMIRALVQSQEIDAVVVGLSEGEMAEKTKQFVKRLRQGVDKPIYFQDETLTSRETRQRIAQAGVAKEKREAKTDHLVAAAILQEFIDDHLPLDSLPKTGKIEAERMG